MPVDAINISKASSIESAAITDTDDVTTCSIMNLFL